MLDDKQLTKALGWASIGLGLPQLIAPRTFTHLIGVGDNANSYGMTLLTGTREVVCGINILTQEQPVGWLWGRVAGDAMDLAILGVALGSKSARRERVIAAIAAVAGAMVMDIYVSLKRS